MSRPLLYTLLTCSLTVSPLVTEAQAKAPSWTLLNSPKAPSDALRWSGNAKPSDGRARGLWQDAQNKAKRLNAKLAQWKGTDTPRGARERARIQAELDLVNPVICRAKVGRAWQVGQLDERAGVCVLFKSRKTRTNCHNRRGPECRHHLPVLGAEVYVLRGASRVVLTDMKRDARAMSAPFVAMVSLGETIFGAKNPICRQGDVAGVLTREGPNLACDSGGVTRASADRMLRGYADIDAYYAEALKPVNAYLGANLKTLSKGMVALERLKGLESARDTFERFEALTAGFHAGVREAVKRVHPDAHIAAGKLVGDKTSALLKAREAYKAKLEAHIAELEISAKVKAMWEEKLAHLFKGVAEFAAKKSFPRDLASGQAELKAIEALKGELDAFEPTFNAMEPDFSARFVSYMKAQAPTFEADLKRFEAREARLKAFVDLETKKADLDALAQRAIDATEKAGRFDGEGKAASKMIATLDGLLTGVDKALTTQGERALSAHAEAVLSPARAPLIAALEKIEPSLSGEERAQRLRLTFERIADDAVTIASSSVANAHALRLMKSDDEVAIQMDMVRALAEYRNRVMTLMAERVDASFRCDMWEDCDPSVDMKRADALVAGLYALPKRFKGRVKQKAGKALAQDLREQGYRWQWPEEEEESTGDGFNGPMISHAPGTLRATLKGHLASPVALWLSCREEQLVGNYVTPKVLLKSCASAAKGLSGGPLMSDMKAAVLKSIESAKHELSAKSCGSLHRRHRGAFFADALGEVCGALKEEERRQKEIAKWQKKIQSAIKRKRFGQATSMLADLEEAGAQGWMVSNMERAIAQAAEYDRDRKARKAAEKRAKRLMSRLPAFEGTCKAKRKSYLYADKQVRNAARRGRPQAAQRHEKKKWAAAEKACEAKRNVLEVYQIYKSWGNDTAADAVLRGATTCMRFWRCN